ncbi:Arylsulfatase precursor [Roseimaritima multifibrata]|uniref:Arylsulfatase n=1 Tax=Roseimaritima multifibrata TaxID=1930274 RepID=A0A517M8X8_9BACT|nr:sulfatase-like hydrolase/transferase [Roseimaritima multifibrata]QDS91324.1 Arylsulfatase precursor [Roseimaritima multifibrata]
MFSFRIVSLLLIVFTTGLARAAEQRAPNVIFILCDDLGWGDLGVFYQNQLTNHPHMKTPHIDKMAEQGLQLRAHYCPAPVCAPSRSTLLTGVHQGHAVVRDNQFDKMLENNHTLATVMRDAGYKTALIGKYGLQGDGSDADSWPGYPTKRGFDEFYGYVRHRDGHLHYPANPYPAGDSPNHKDPKEVWHNDQEVSAGLSGCYTTDLFTARSKDWIAKQATQHPEQPFFLYLAYDTPHAALQVPAVEYPEGSGLNGGLQWLGEPGKMINTAVGTIDSYRHPDYADQEWSDGAIRFATMVRRIDSAVGDLLQTLQDLGIDENTLVVFSSDNGPHRESYLSNVKYDPTAFKSYGRFDGIKRDTLEGGIRVPTLAWWPSHIKPGQVTHAPSQFHDWMPTFAEIAGALSPARSDGVSLLPTLQGNRKQTPSTIYVEYVNNGATPNYSDFAPLHRGQKRRQMQVVHVDGFKGIRVNIQSAKDPFEIYDLAKDPQERTNLAGTSDRFRRLQQKMQDRVLQLRRPNPSAKRPYDDALVPAVDGLPEESIAEGLHWRARNGSFAYVPSLQGQTPDQIGTVDHIDLKQISIATGAVEWSGYFKVPADGDYTFTLSTSRGAFLRIHDAAVIDADAQYEAGSDVTGTIRLAKGWHPIRLTCLKAEADDSLTLTWAASDSEPQPFVTADLRQP